MKDRREGKESDYGFGQNRRKKMNQKDKTERIYVASDYMEGAHPHILRRLQETNYDKTPGYGTDEICQSARERIRQACACPEAEVHFLVGGTQTNSTVIRALLSYYQGVIAADTGHISLHESGAIEAGGHKVLPLPSHLGKIDAEQIEAYLRAFYEDANHEHMVMPGMVYVSHPTEYGTLYSREELSAIHQVCQSYGIPLYVDGARMAYALACPENELSLTDFARLTDVFYIGGTKCGAFIGEAVVIPKKGLIPHFFTIIKQSGALLAKGRFLGIQFDELFRDDLYLQIGREAVRLAQKLQAALIDMGYRIHFHSPTNQIFVVMDQERLDRLEQQVSYDFWEKLDETHTAIRFCTSWATEEKTIDALIDILRKLA